MQCVTETRFWYWERKLRSSFGIGIGNQNFFFNFFPTFLWDTSFHNLKIEHRSFKNNLNICNILQQIRFQGSFYDEKVPHTIGKKTFCLKCGFGISYCISRKYRPIWVSVSIPKQWFQSYTTVMIYCPVSENFVKIDVQGAMATLQSSSMWCMSTILVALDMFEL